MRMNVFGRMLLVVLLVLLVACQKQETRSAGKGHGKLVVVTTLFPLYDFAKNVGGDKAQVTLLLPPGVEAHSFEPKPADAVKIARADLFVFTSKTMEPWVPGFLKGIGSTSATVVDSSKGVKLLQAGPEQEEAEREAGHHHEGGIDPHIWLDFGNAQVMVDNIAAGMETKDPANAAYYRANAEAYKAKLQKLDAEYQVALTHCSHRSFLHGGHYAFGYLAHRYGLDYHSASAFNAEAEPSPARLVDLVKQLKAMGTKYIYSEELLSPRVAELLAKETGTTVLPLHGAHNISRDDLTKGVGFISLMERNLVNLRLGLDCK